MRNFFKEFKAFISRGNIMDLAIGVIIGGAFNKIVTSLVNDIIMPLITSLLGAESLSALSVPLKWSEVTNEAGLTVEVVTLSWNYGNFLQTILDFLIIALCVFILIKVLMKSQTMFKEASELVTKDKLTKAEKKEIKAEGINLKDKEAVKAYKEEKARRLAQKKAEEEAKQKELEEEKKKNSTEYLLKEILLVLKGKDKPEEELSSAIKTVEENSKV